MSELRKTSIFIAGDSTASSYPIERAPQAGWGQVLNQFFMNDIRIVNEAASGRSSKSFVKEERLLRIDEKLKANDYLFIQFGHNDAKQDDRYTEPFLDFKDYLNQYIDVALKKGATPVLITPVQRRSFDENGNFEEIHGQYPYAIRQVAKERNVPVIDLTKRSREYLEKLGSEESKKIFLWVEKGSNKNYPDGLQDNTHFCEEGAYQIARLIVEGIRELDLPIVEFIDE
ncbi:MAG TPA: rhamnogalacturonan acetylesterase [Metabacillus sp.]|nr:rhamnogalacturonan acetylesterase [Metabacillus sp.]